MSEADVIEQMVEYLNVLLVGVSVFFTVVSAYVVAIWVFLRHAGFALRAFSFLFLTFVLAFLIRIAVGAQQLHDGFVATLIELEQTVGLSPAGQAALDNTRSGVDWLVSQSLFGGAAIIYVALFLLTVFARSTFKSADA
ncbi:MAG: hypothetical protein AAFX09_01480 [Pseudomonadota bacterium]